MAKNDSPLHIRDMVPAEPEMMASDDIAYTELFTLTKSGFRSTGQYMHWDPKSQKAIHGPKPPEGELVPTGGMLAVDTVCRDCGAHLQAGHVWPTPASKGVYYLLCSRLVTQGYKGAMPEPYTDSVVECGNWQAPEPDLTAQRQAMAMHLRKHGYQVIEPD